MGLVGVDEAGRGALAGPVVAGAVFLPKSFFQIRGRRQSVAAITDSKALQGEIRAKLFQTLQDWIQAGELLGATGSASVEEIEILNILGATRLAMVRALESLQQAGGDHWVLERVDKESLLEPPDSDKNPTGPCPRLVLDGRPMRSFPYTHESLVQGDGKSLSIAMGSILAKVTRDRQLVELEADFPGYGFAEHKGYGTPAHREALHRRGPTPVHRPTFLRKILGEVVKSQERFDFDSAD